MAKMVKIIKTGAFQTVRLPKGFRFEEDEVCIKRVGHAVMLFPRSRAWDMMEDAIKKCDGDFMQDRNQPKQQVRKGL
jgi:antitoxin VapB